MDLELVRTFLAVSSAGSLTAAAGHLHMTQAAVSARLRTLETELDTRLFVRNKSGARLTPAGRAFLPHATQLMQMWERARAEVALGPNREAVLSIGAEVSLWSGVLLNWVVKLRTDRPTVALRTETDSVQRLLDRLQNGTLDIAVLYTEQRRPGVGSTLVLVDELVAVSTRKRDPMKVDNYIYVDWGPDFRARHDQAFPNLRNANLQANLGPLALRCLLRLGGSGYFRTRAVQSHIEAGRLHPIKRAPKFSYSLYAAHAESVTPELRDWALAELQDAAKLADLDWA